MLNGPSYQLLVDSNTTIRECQYQLAIIVGAVGEGQKWLFGGALLLSGRTLGFYQISSQNVIDIIPSEFFMGSGMIVRLCMTICLHLNYRSG